jgi:hypothetical protein
MNDPTHKRFKRTLLLFLIIVLLVIIFTWKSNLGQTQSQYSVEMAFPNLMFNQPVGIVSSGEGSNMLFVIEQAGIIRVFENLPAVSTSNVFLDIQSKVLYGGEQGLLGLAFHPNYAVNGYFYVNYVAANPTRTIIARYSVSSNSNQALENSELVLLEVNQPFSNHKGGQLAFDADGYLYIGLGDGGSGGDPFGNGQNRTILLGKILRIDVDSTSSDRNYGIPSDNPYSGNALGYREEIYAYGFRNPWRFSFDALNGRLWVGDVGQNQREEIDVVEKGKNYGWNIMEGSIAYAGGDQTGLELPVWDYFRSEGICVIGGYSYYGSVNTELYSKYIFGDYGSGKIWALNYSGTGQATNTLLVDTDLSISSFGLGNQKEIYICSLDGRIYTLKTNIPSPSPSNPTSQPSTPNPTPPSSQTVSPTPSQTPTNPPSLQPTTTPPPPQPRDNSLIIYMIIVFATLAVIAASIILVKKRGYLQG